MMNFVVVCYACLPEVLKPSTLSVHEIADKACVSCVLCCLLLLNLPAGVCQLCEAAKRLGVPLPVSIQVGMECPQLQAEIHGTHVKGKYLMHQATPYERITPYVHGRHGLIVHHTHCACL